MGALDVAVVGMHCRFPGAESVADYWDVIRNGESCFSATSGRPFHQMLADACARFGMDLKAASTAGLISNPYAFDNKFFRISGREAEAMDPQARVLLEAVVHLLESSLVASTDIEGARVGLFVGISNADYLHDIIGRLGARDRISIHHAVGNSAATTVGRVAYHFNWHGPALAVDTACSSSLTAIGLACDALESGAVDIAIAGGVNLILNHLSTVAFMSANMLSPDGQCRPFDSRANGYVRGEGCGLVMLKRLADAQADGNQIHAVVKSVATNHNGTSYGLTAPNPASQAELIAACWLRSGLHETRLDYIEAHGTGTKLGDPIEIRSLSSQIKKFSAGPVRIGSVKANIGHCEAAAGVAGFIKAVLVAKHRLAPPQSNFEEINPLIAQYCDDVLINKTSTALDPSATVRVAVSSFGFGGGNAHALIESAPNAESTPSAAISGPSLIGISAKTASALEIRLTQLERLLEASDAGGGVSFSYVAQEAQYFDHHEKRISLLAEDVNGLKKGVRNALHALSRSPSAAASTRWKLASFCSADASEASDELLDAYRAFDLFGTAFDLATRAGEHLSSKTAAALFHLVASHLAPDRLAPLSGQGEAHRTPTGPRYPAKPDSQFISRFNTIACVEPKALDGTLVLSISDELRITNPEFAKAYGQSKYCNTLTTFGVLYSLGILDSPPRLRTARPAVRATPLYPFERVEHYHQEKGAAGSSESHTPSPPDALSSLLYRDIWRPVEVASVEPGSIVFCTPRSAQVPEPVFGDSGVVVFTDAGELTSSLSALTPRSVVLCLRAQQLREIGQICWDALSICRAMAAFDKSALSLHIAVDMSSPGGEPLFGSLSGLMATLALEIPHASGMLIAVDDFGDRKSFDALTALVENGLSRVELYARIQKGDVFVKRLTPVPYAAPRGGPVSADARHGAIISGAASTLALGVAHRLLRQGVKDLILVGKSAPTEAVSAFVAEASAKGASAQYVCCDLLDQPVVSRLSKTLDRSRTYTLFHAAGVLGSASRMADLPREDFDAVWRPKVDGFLNLVDAFGERISSVYLFSSVSSLWGLAGHAPYAMANGFLNGITARSSPFGADSPRITCHLWSIWRDSRMAQAIDDLSKLETIGLRPLSHERGLDCLEQLFATSTDRYVVADLDPAATASSLTRAASLFREIVERRAAVNSSVAKAQVRKAASQGSIVQFILNHLKTREKLQLDSNGDLDKGFYSLGLNSLAILELKSVLGKEFGVDLSANDLFNAPTINLVSKLIAEMTVASFESASPATIK
ncbi:SDR family NAD(P)-dependent oxidoreductase [Caballeronia sp. dw_276]|uniref:SDR family NAD(P)-dependent oxidoreductase n=1 Tax=Caballeronia sp. dw_276 TaxID=2719795 RepID=UPI001BD579DC|nr:SDR family NAD(P)-dependent oxidoreductase [Caballeronia sp. dw_276]